ncbi:D-alanyl-D-alanine carboxypeptidase [Clostridioides mangenotii]|uniref:D-alanyl-D-alanine carboxypeptidase family protein n=1 Tax=Metaclostridioides mangenotii TaxID=1540 RepID=UPI00214A78E5|nr:D-alanyl-D-alanine carboxypeptidase family protein [Clostridioides mangenotii]MCR1954087.1 D-alanyl-D-alanine carboxypeptidase [Clostridioides mangenotii]
MKRILSLLLVGFVTIAPAIGMTNISYAINNEENNTTQTTNETVNPIKGDTENKTTQEVSNKDSLPLQAKYAVLLDYETGKTLYSKNGNQKLYPASTTKMWTAYNVLKNVSDLNEIIKIEDLPTIEGSSMYLKDGESFTVKQLLDALLVHSSNDSAFVLARYVGKGDVNKFVEMMNTEAKAIGAGDTHFTNPHGLPDPNHYTTAHDMAVMSRKAMSNTVFREIVKTTYIKYDATEAYPFERHFSNTNQLLTSSGKMSYKGKEVNIKYDIVDGIKTGFTDAAGKCLLSSAVKDDRRVIAAVFNSTNDGIYLDSRELLDYGFDNYYTATVLDREDYVKTKKVMFTKQKELIYKPKYSYKLTLKNGEQMKDYTIKSNLDEINLPVNKGDKVGTLDVYSGSEKEKSIDLIAQNNLNNIFAFITENALYFNIFKGVLGLAVILIVVKIGFKIKKKRNK